MKKTIAVTTDFSQPATNALDYACEFAKAHHFNILLVHIYTIPANYAGDGMSLVTINDALEADKNRLKEELERVKQKYNADVEFEARMLVGDFVEALNELKKLSDPEMLIMGAEGEYSELWIWGSDWLDALITIDCPILVVPHNSGFRPIKKIAFACDYKNKSLRESATEIKGILSLFNDDFYIVNVNPKPGMPVDETGMAVLKEVFNDREPLFRTVINKRVIVGLAQFVKETNIDLLIVIPHKHDLWYNLFNKSHTKQLAMLNHLPVMAIHEDGKAV